jgi:hypothetical protein
MNKRDTWATLAALAGMIMIAGLAGGLRARPAAARWASQAGGPAAWQTAGPQEGLAIEAAVPGTITYQGRLANPGGQSLSGIYTMQFRLFNAASGGNLLFDSHLQSIQVTDGHFAVALNAGQAAFNGQALWLEIAINSETLSPRQALHPAPYALGLKPGATVAGDPPSASGAVLRAELAPGWPNGSALGASAPATGAAVRGQAAGGLGLAAHSNSNTGVQATSNTGVGGYFLSQQGYGIVAGSGGTDHWDHGAVITSTNGYAVMAASSNNMAIRGHSGNITDAWQPVGAVGVVGIGQLRGVYGSSLNSYGVYGTSLNWYGVYGRTSRAGGSYGLYTPHNLFVGGTTTTAGATMAIVQNGGDTALEPGDVAVFSGMSPPLIGSGQPVPQVSVAAQANSPAVAGVVYSRYNIAVLELDETGADPPPGLEITPAGAVAPGEYMLLVVQGVAQVKASAVGGPIAAGDLMSAGGAAGTASLAQTVSLQGVETALPGAVFGKALEPLSEGQDMIYIWVTLR